MNICLTPENEKPLDNLISGGGFASIFRNVVCIGDSLSSGEFQLKEGDVFHYYDMFDYSWGQFMAREAGINVKNYSMGGMTGVRYRTVFADKRGLWDETVIPEAYIIALGVNDSNAAFNGKIKIGDISDIDFENIENCKDTFAGNYGYIMLRYKKFNPDAFFFLTTMPILPGKNEKPIEIKKKINDLIREIASKMTNTFVLELDKYAPVYDAEFKENFFMNGHMNAMGYVLTAKMMISYIDYIVRHNMKTFNEIGFINKKNYGYKIQ